MSYSRPIVMTDGDIVSTVYFKRERQRWIAYEAHAHTGDEDGATQTDLLIALPFVEGLSPGRVA